MSNKHRGEVEIALGGRAYTLRPTFEALVEFEEKSGLTAFEAMRDCMTNQRAPAKAIAAAFWAGIRGAWEKGNGNPPTFGEVGGFVQKAGIKQCLEPYLLFLTYAITSEDDLAKMKEEAEKGKDGSG